jgi:hypothetical protein
LGLKIATEKMKKYKSPNSNQILDELTQPGSET